ncbi:MAG: hypothetical protein IKS68_06390, partial [Mailhella sp.]|nr:hypothetical protein [Mailhella sp.]
IENRRGDGAAFAGLHPNGIIDLAVRPEIRMATAAIDLLDTLEQGQEEERLDSLRTLRDNVLVSAHTSLRYNTARVLIQIMKMLVRSQEDHESRLALAHDFRMAASGKPSVVRKLLRRYFLLEMPEEWNQAVFDDHVHDANTKGRKNATHLIMDAWVKGIRSLTVIYYNYVTVGAAHELLTAAEIMGIKVRIGILLTASFRGTAVDLIWGPRGFSDADGFLSFLNEPDVRALMEEGICATRWQEQHVVTVLRFWNANERKDLEKRLGWGIEPLDSEEFLEFVGTGQASLIHLAEYIHYSIMPDLTLEAQRISALIAAPDTSAETRKTLHARLVDLDTITPERLLEELSGCESVERTFREFSDADVPELLRQEPYPLLKRVTGLHSGNRVTLNLANLTPEDVLTLLWDCRGLITHLEIFNIKDWQEGSEPFTKEIGELQHAINEGSVPMLKQIIRSMISGCVGDEKPILGDRISLRSENLMHIAAYSSPAPTPEERTEKLHEILGGITVLQGYYKKKKLATRLGTDSTSRPGRRAGMGLAYEQSLPARARRELKANTRNSTRLRLPVRLELHEKIEYTVTDESADGPLAKIVRAIPGFRHHGMPRTRSWLPVDENCTICNEGECSQEGKDSEKCNHGNIITLGGIGKYTGNGFCPENAHPEFDPSVRLHHLNTVLENVLKILIGFIPALIAFLMTQETLFLALIGAPAFYVITAVRNIIQSLIAAGGVSSTSMRHWNYYVDWTRLCDSLMYTGLSVVLLELVVRVWVLQDMFGVNASNAPLFTYTAISLVNGAYVA